MVKAHPLWIDEGEEKICQGCSHSAEDHVLVIGPNNSRSYPCGAEEKFDTDFNGRMILTDEPCECEAFENN
jgi:F420-dependent methylenetetrahydromethanopterin dehydrogenase